MERELHSTVMVSFWAATSMVYARFASARIPPGRRRLLALLPAILLLPGLPRYFSSVNLRIISASTLVWHSVFKLLLLAFGSGPLSPSLPLLPFVATATLPVTVSCSPTTKNPRRFSTTPRLILSTAARVLVLSAVLLHYRHRHRMHHYLLRALHCVHLYLAIELVLTSVAFIAGGLLGLDLEPHFDTPYFATSLRDFWGRRWNLMVTSTLRPMVFVPVRARWGPSAAVMATFLVSGVMHEVTFYFVALTAPEWEFIAFFVLHGACVLAEERVRRARWRTPHPVVAAPIVIGFTIVTSSWLFFRPFVRSGLNEMVIKECEAVMELLEGGVRGLLGRPGFG